MTTKDILPSVALDGPAGAGKTTIAAAIAQRTGFRHIDSGAMYRAVTLQALESGKWSRTADDKNILVKLAEQLDIQFESRQGAQQRIYIDDVERTGDLRSSKVEGSVSTVASVPPVRAALVQKQKELARAGGVIMDGRDIGTCVLTDARVKVYLTAALPVRISRRLVQRRCQGEIYTWEQAAASVINRDRIDSTRKTSPLRPAEDAVVLDSTHLRRDDVVMYITFMLDSCMD